MIEIPPIVYLDKRLIKEGECVITKNADDKSVQFDFRKFRIKIAPSTSKILLIGASADPSIWVNDRKLPIGSYEIVSYQNQSKPGVDIFFPQGLPLKQLSLIPRVLLGEDERKYQARRLKEKRERYFKDHGYLWK